MEQYINEKIEYCLNCKNPQCKLGCPLGNNIPEFIYKMKQNDYKGAYDILTNTTVLSSICGRICPHQKQCEGKCIREVNGSSVSIGELEAIVGDWALNNKNSLLNSFLKKGMPKEKKKQKVAIIGGGPAGITCAAFLRKQGFKVTIYEKQKTLGGILKKGIPEFRLKSEIVDKVIEQILNLDIEVKYEKELGKNLRIKQIEKKYDAIFLSIGANIPHEMGIEGEELNGVFGGNILLEKENYPSYKGKKVAIIGGGNVAMDCARTIKRKGAKQVIVIYRRSEKEMPAELKEIEVAKKEGIEFLFFTNVIKILGNKKVEKIECIKTKLIDKKGEKRKVFVNIENSNYIIDIDYVVIAVGRKINEDVLKQERIEITENKYVKIDEEFRTSNKKIFAGGDITGQTFTVAWAARDGREVARKMATLLGNTFN